MASASIGLVAAVDLMCVPAGPAMPTGLRIDPELFARSKMGYSTGLAILPSDQMVPAAPDNKFIKHITGGGRRGGWLQQCGG